MQVGLSGALGLIGRAIADGLRRAGHDAVPLDVGRLSFTSVRTADPVAAATDLAESPRGRHLIEQFSRLAEKCDIVVCAAGRAMPDAKELDDELLTANSFLPRLLLEGAEAAAVPRFVHISSAAVASGHRPMTEVEADPSVLKSPYAASKALGEQVVLAFSGTIEPVIYRPTSLMHPQRGTTSRFVAALSKGIVPAGVPLPICTLPSIVRCVMHICTESACMGPIVLHPFEGIFSDDCYRVLSLRPARHGELLQAVYRVVRSRSSGPQAMASLLGRLDASLLGDYSLSSISSTDVVPIATSARELLEALGGPNA